MKDYDHVIIWIDYFNKHLSRKKGRRVSKDQAVYDPSLSELIESANIAGFSTSNDTVNANARYPRRPFVRSGYIMIEKKELKKDSIIDLIAKKMLEKRQKSK